MLPERMSALFTAPRRARRAIGRIAAALGLVVVFTTALAASALLHLTSRTGLRAARVVVNDLLRDSFRGRLEIGEITHVSLGAIEIARADVFDPDGVRVVEAEDVSARFSTIHLLRSLFVEDGDDEPIWIAAPRIRIGRGVVRLLPDATGSPSIGAAFAPRVAKPNATDARPVIVSLPRIELDDVIVEGDVGRPIHGRVTGLVGSVGLSDGHVLVDVDEATLEDDALLPAKIQGAATYHLRIDLPPHGRRDVRARSSMWAGFHGALGASRVDVDAQLSGSTVTAKAEVPSITPAALRALMPAAPFETNARATIEVEGTLPELTANARIELAGSSDESPGRLAPAWVEAEAHVDVSTGPRIEASFVASELDPRAFLPSLPAIAVGATGRARLDFTKGAVRASVELSSRAAILRPDAGSGPVVIPAIDAIADLVDDRWIGSATVYDRGIPLDTRFSIDPGGAVSFAARGAEMDLGTAPRLAALLGPGMVRGTAAVDLRGSIVEGKLTADARVSVRNLAIETSAGPVRAEGAGIVAQLAGPFDALDVDAEAQALNVSIADESFDRVDLAAKGPLLTPAISLVLDDADLGHTTANGSVDLTHGTATGITFSVERNGEKAEGKIARVGPSPGGLVIEGVEISGGLGTASASLRVEGGELLGTFKGESLDLDRVRKIAGIREPIGGIANVDIALERSPKGRRGHLEIEVQRGAYLVEGLAARLSARFDGEDVESTGYARLVVRATDEERKEAHEGGLLAENALCDGAIAEVRLSSLKGKLRGPLLAPSTWLSATGDARVALENVNLKCLSEYPLVSLFLPVSKLAGLVSARAHVAREEGDALPSIRDVAVRTLGLEIVGPSGLFSDDEPWSTRGVDIAARGEFDGRTGHATAKASFFDGTLLADATAEVTVDPDALGLAVTTGPSGALTRLLERAPMAATVDFPRRSLSDMGSFPSFVRDALPPLAGDLRFDADASGTIAHPHLEFHANAFGVGPSASGAGGPGPATGPSDEERRSAAAALAWAPALDVDLIGTYDDFSSTTTFTALVVHGDATVARVDGGVLLPFGELLHPKDDAPIAWSAGAVVSMNGLPLQSFPDLSKYDVAGSVTGTLVLADWNRDPSLDARLGVPDLTIGDVGYAAHVDVHLGANAADQVDGTWAGGRGTATALVELTDQKGEGLVAFGLGASAWSDHKIPDLDRTQPAFLCLVPKRFELGALTPLVVPTLSHLEGRVTGAMGVGVSRLDALDTGMFSGSVELEDGVVFIPQLGQELSAVDGKIVASQLEVEVEDGKTQRVGVLEVERLTAQGIAGELEGNVKATFAGLDFKEAKGKIAIAEGKEIPFTLEGVPVGFASASVEYTATYKPEERTAEGELVTPSRVTIATTVPLVRLQLPDSSSRDVQDLDEDPTILRSEILAPPEAPRAANATIYDLVVGLDRAVVTGTDMGVTIVGSGQPIKIELGERLVITGEVSLPSGFVVVRGKRFEIDRGLVRFQEKEAGNPYVNVTAHWEDPNGARVYIDYVGDLYPISEEKIRFRSDPPRSKEDIIATLLFGTDLTSTPVGQAPTEATTQGVTTLAADLTSTLASSALNALFAAKNVSLKVDTTSGAFRGSVEWRAAEGLTLGLSGEQVQSSTTGAATQQSGAQFGGSIEWRLNDNWYLRSTFGAGVREPSTGVDVFWTSGY